MESEDPARLGSTLPPPQGGGEGEEGRSPEVNTGLTNTEALGENPVKCLDPEGLVNIRVWLHTFRAPVSLSGEQGRNLSE